ncbi:ferritin-like domain-containing protein [Anseongella ginsenosidimutans]|nr:ferritin-like domain-containing protein [Anseongella ginsenosidimutans]
MHQLFLDQLKDLYWAENHIVESLPKMVKAATSQELKDALEEHIEVSKTHVERLEQTFESLDEKAEGKVCPAIKGLVKEGEEIIAETEGDTMTRDAALIIAAQKIEHYEIASYGSMVTLAKRMKHKKAAELLGDTLGEEKETDTTLTSIAESFVNEEAAQE